MKSQWIILNQTLTAAMIAAPEIGPGIVLPLFDDRIAFGTDAGVEEERGDVFEAVRNPTGMSDRFEEGIRRPRVWGEHWFLTPAP